MGYTIWLFFWTVYSKKLSIYMPVLKNRIFSVNRNKKHYQNMPFRCDARAWHCSFLMGLMIFCPKKLKKTVFFSVGWRSRSIPSPYATTPNISSTKDTYIGKCLPLRHGLSYTITRVSNTIVAFGIDISKDNLCKCIFGLKIRVVDRSAAYLWREKGWCALSDAGN